MLETFAQDLASPHGVAGVVTMLLALLARDVVVGFLRAFARRTRENKDPKDDAAGDAAEAIANGIERMRVPPSVKK